MFITGGKQRLTARHAHARGPGFPHWTIGCELGARVRIAAAGREFVVGPDFLIAVRPRTEYRISYAGGTNWRERWTIFSPRAADAWDDRLSWPELAPGVGHLRLGDTGGAARREIVAAFDELVRRMAEPTPDRDALSFNALEKALLLAQRLSPRAGRPRIDSRIRGAIDYVAANLTAELDVAAVARAVHLSPSRLAHLFREQTGEPVMRFLEGRRLERARDLLLTTDLPIKEAARASGYEDAFHFSTRFRKRFGQSPREFRRAPK